MLSWHLSRLCFLCKHALDVCLQLSGLGCYDSPGNGLANALILVTKLIADSANSMPRRVGKFGNPFIRYSPRGFRDDQYGIGCGANIG